MPLFSSFCGRWLVFLSLSIWRKESSQPTRLGRQWNLTHSSWYFIKVETQSWGGISPPGLWKWAVVRLKLLEVISCMAITTQESNWFMLTLERVTAQAGRNLQDARIGAPRCGATTRYRHCLTVLLQFPAPSSSTMSSLLLYKPPSFYIGTGGLSTTSISSSCAIIGQKEFSLKRRESLREASNFWILTSITSWKWQQHQQQHHHQQQPRNHHAIPVLDQIRYNIRYGNRHGLGRHYRRVRYPNRQGVYPIIRGYYYRIIGNIGPRANITIVSLQ